jgi:hypoxanthine phosphoribosyltransferase
MENPLQKTLLRREQIQQRVAELAEEIRALYGDDRLFLICLLKGAVVFLSDLMRHLGPNAEFYFVNVSSYRGGTTPEGPPELIPLPHPAITGQHVLLIEDILDTGETLAAVRDHFAAVSPASLRICVLLAKEGYRTSPVPDPDFLGFVIPQEFVVGYGLDYQERYRGLPDIGVPADLADQSALD